VKSKTFLYFTTVFFLLIAVFASVFLTVQKKVNWFTRAEAEKAQLWILPTRLELNRGDKAEIKVVLVSGSNGTGGVDLVLKYNPALLEIVDNTIKPGEIFDYYRDRLIDSRRGLIKLSSLGRFEGRGVFASFAVKGKTSGSGKLEIINSASFVDSTVVWDREEKTNILGNTYNLFFEVH